jgi:hypothetical protein
MNVKHPVVTADEVARDLVAGKIGGAYDLHEDSLQGTVKSTGAGAREIDEPDRYAAVVTSIGRRRSYPHSGHSYRPTTVSGRDESECIERNRIGTLSSWRSQLGASS